MGIEYNPDGSPKLPFKDDRKEISGQYEDPNKKFNTKETIAKVEELGQRTEEISPEVLEMVRAENIDWHNYEDIDKVINFLRNNLSFKVEFTNSAEKLVRQLRQNPDHMKYRLYHFLSGSTDFSKVEDNFFDFDGDLSILKFLKRQLTNFKQKNNIE